jgi:DNA/RNA-binding domain of Phe-tRNA-synthetase-like protein
VIEAAVDPRVFDRHPDYVAVVVAASGLVNGPSDAGSDGRLAEAERHLRARGLARAADAPEIAAWRAAFSAFGAKPKQYPCSAEALAQRVLKGGELPRVNRLVDLYNAISVRRLIPVGGEDLDRLRGPLRLTFAAGDERFDAPGGDEPPRPGEVVWRDDVGVTCRRWNWRQARRTQLTAETTAALFILDALEPMTDEALAAAADELVAHLSELGPDVTASRRLLSAGDAEGRA